MDRTLIQASFVFLAALSSGTLNSVAGGGGLIMFPTLLMTGMSPVVANATSTIAALPGLIAGAKAYHPDLREVKRLCIVFSSVSLLGGTIGALFVLWIPGEILKQLVPYLLLLATLLFTFSDALLSWLPAILPKANQNSASFLQTSSLILFFVAIYGGFYGLGISFLLLAVLRLLGLDQIHQINGLKVLLMSCNTVAAAIAFVPAEVIDWSQALFIMLGSTIGGYAGAYYARMLNPKLIRYLIIMAGFSMTGYFFIYT
ncbi:sulfite exporter TauE/SafE family protein [Phormidium tenue FACHB-886]|nr:sulfite exporter TauE/SafE family protein [Phormidium tenue FACHB-886]